MTVWTKLPYPHVCFHLEMVYDADFNEWQCSICHKKYQPPQIEVPTVPTWKPWEIPVERLCLPYGLYWLPERDYRAWKVKSEFRVWI